MNKKLNELIAESQNLSNSMSALSRFSYDRIQIDNVSINEINELNGIITAIQCLAEKHAKDMEAFETIA